MFTTTSRGSLLIELFDLLEGEETDQETGLSSLQLVGCATLVLLIRHLLREKMPLRPYNDPGRVTARFLELVEKDYAQRGEVSYYAKKLLVTEHYLSEICQEMQGQRAKAIIQDRRLREAKRLLLETNLSGKEIAFRIGLEPDYFSRFFKERTGLGAMEYRIKG